MVVATLVGGAPGGVAFDLVRVVLQGVVLRALVVRANWFAALGLLAFARFTLDVVGVVDEGVAVRAVDGVAVLRI